MTSVSKPNFKKLYVPILIEQLFMMLMGQTDVIMLSAYNAEALAISGISTQILTLLTFIITIIHVGVSIRLVHQKEISTSDISAEIYHSITLNLLFSIIFSVIVCLNFHWILFAMQVPQDIFRLTYTFGIIFVIGLPITTSQMLSATLLRILDSAHIAAKITIVINLLNIVLNCNILFIFPDYIEHPVLAVAFATLFSRLLGLVLGIYYLISRYPPKVHYFKLKWLVSKKVIFLGLPGAGEQISYNFAQTVTTAFIAILGTQVIAAKSLTAALSNLSFCIAMAYSLASQIYLGRLIARQKFKVLNRSVRKGLWINALRSLIVILVVAVLFYGIGRYIARGEAVYHLTLIYLLFFMFLEPLRAINNYIVDLLNVAGDVRYPVSINIITTWCVLVPFSFLTAIVLDWGYVSIIIVNIIEEGLRFILMKRRWNQGTWKFKLSQIGVRSHV